MLKGIRTVILDLGGVLININYNRTIEKFTALGAAPFAQAYSQHNQQETFDAFETGKITAKEFRSRINKYCNTSLTDHQFDDAWNAMLLDLPLQRISLLLRLKEHYRLFLLSNTNDTHIEWFRQYLDSIYGYDLFTQLFEKVYYSHKVGLRKPDREIFEFVLSENNLKGNETLFIDDSLQHIIGATKCGIRAVHLQPPKTIIELFSESI